MRITYIHQHFITNRGAGGTRSYDVARHMVRAGHEVHMICGIYDTSGFATMPRYRFTRNEIIDGIHVTICNVVSSNRFSAAKRTLGYLWFAVLATIAALKVRSPDLVFATSTPLTVGIPGYVVSRVKRIPFVFEVRDIWPESFIRSGWVTGRELSIRLMGLLEVFIYKHAEKILLVSPGFEKRLVERGFPSKKMKSILLGADGAVFENAMPDQRFIERHALADKTVAIFTGAHGKSNGLYYVLDAAEQSKDRTNIAYVLIGEGYEKQRLIEYARRKKLDNVIFLDAVPKEDLPSILGACHIGLMILRNIGESRPVTPNKIFDYMFMGMPSLVNFEGATMDMVRADGSGYYVDPTRPEDLADKVRMLADRPQLRAEIGQRARKAALEKYDRKIISDQLMVAFESLVAPGKRRRPPVTAGRRKESVLILDGAAKSSIPVLESCAAMGLHTIAASDKKHCCGFHSRATRERLLVPSMESEPDACLQFLLRFLRQRSVTLMIPLGHAMTAFIARHQDAIRTHTRLVLPSYEVFQKGLSKISTLKAAQQVNCPTPKNWYPAEQPLKDIAVEVTYPVLIKPAVSVGARGLTYCHSATELMAKLPRVETRYGESSVQEFIPQTGIQYKCAIVVDRAQTLLAGIVYAKLRYYPVDGGSSTLNKSVHRPDIMQHCLNIARRLKWVGACDFDWITDPRDNTAKLMEINPRFSDTFKMTAVAGQDMTRIVYELAKGETPKPQIDYQKDKYLRFIFGDILWFLKAGKRRWSARPSFFDFFRSDTTYLMTGQNDLGPLIGYILENLSLLWDRKARQFRLRRHDV